jgi:hypothetical protein
MFREFARKDDQVTNSKIILFNNNSSELHQKMSKAYSLM